MSTTVCQDCGTVALFQYVTMDGATLHERCARKRIESRPGFIGWADAPPPSEVAEEGASDAR